MEIIQEMLQLVKKAGIESTGMFDLGSNGNLVDRYVKLVLKAKTLDDNDIAEKLYGADRSDPRYKNLKKRVKKKLIDSIPAIDKEFLGFRSEYNQVYYDCMELVHRVQLLSKISAYDTTISLINKMYPIALKYQFYNILKIFSYHLVRIYAIKGESKNVQAESVKLEMYQEEEKNITRVFSLYFQTISQLVNNSKTTQHQLEELNTHISKLDLVSKNSESFEVKYWTNYLQITYLILVNNNQLLLKSLNEFEKIFEEWDNFLPARRTAFSIQKLSILFQLKDYENGLIFANKNEHWLLTHQSNWSLFKRHEFYHAINIDYCKALNIYKEVQSSDFMLLNNNERTSQLWVINHAFLQFLLNYYNHPEALKFNIYKFVNEYNIYSKDKGGYNFSIFVIEMMFYLLNDDIDNYIERTTALMAYRLRHLKQKSFKRSSTFAQLLLEVEKHRFDPVKLMRSAKKKYDYLASLEDRLNINEWEIIGYETLWDIVIDLLEKRKK